VGVINGSPLAMGLLTMNPPPEWHPAPEDVKEAARRAVDICRRHGADLATLGMQFALAEPRIACTLTGTARVSELEANLRALSAPVDPAVREEVDAALAAVQRRGWPSGNWPAA
jgi:L-galactose dehydrogenase